MKSIKVESGQTILDLCVQEYGTLEAAFKIHLDNALSEFPAVLQAGQLIAVDADYESPDIYAVKLLQSNKPATEENVTGYVIPSGIGYWRIGIDFKVS